MRGLDDPFLSQHLNPFFLRLVNTYWDALLHGDIKEKEILEKSQFNLLRFVFRRLFQSIYAKHKVTTPNSVFFLSRILPDGIGDYYSLLKCAKFYAMTQPLVDVHVVYSHDQTLPIINAADYSLLPKNIHSFFEYKNAQILEPVLEASAKFSFDQVQENLIKEREEWRGRYDDIRVKKGYAVKSLEEMIDDLNGQIQRLETRKKLQYEAESIYTQLKQSSAIVHIALAFNTFDNPDFSTKSMYFAEMGNFQGIGNALQRNWFSMGLHPFDEGIFLKKVFTGNTPWKEEKLPLLLWNTSHPTAAITADYFKHHSLYMGYLHRIPQQQKLFINLVCAKEKSNPRTIDIILPTVQSKERAYRFDPAWLAAQGIQKVVSMDLDQSVEILMETGASSHKILRLIHCLPLPSSDFENLLRLSDDVLGCTGDGSLSDCLASGKVPFYEMRKHKIEVIEALQQVAKDLHLKCVGAYFDKMADASRLLPETVAEELVEILRRNSFKNEWSAFLNFIKQYYCFEDSMLSHINRHILIGADPNLKANEEKVIHDYFKGKVLASGAYEAVQSKVIHRT